MIDNSLREMENNEDLNLFNLIYSRVKAEREGKSYNCNGFTASVVRSALSQKPRVERVPGYSEAMLIEALYENKNRFYDFSKGVSYLDSGLLTFHIFEDSADFINGNLKQILHSGVIGPRIIQHQKITFDNCRVIEREAIKSNAVKDNELGSGVSIRLLKDSVNAYKDFSLRRVAYFLWPKIDFTIEL
jgi:hypothetical protein